MEAIPIFYTCLACGAAYRVAAIAQPSKTNRFEKPAAGLGRKFNKSLTRVSRGTLKPGRAGHEGVERRPELAAIVVLFLKDLVAAAGQDEMPAGEQIDAEILDGRCRDHFIVAGRHQQNRLANGRGISWLGETLHQPERGIGPGDGRCANTK